MVIYKIVNINDNKVYIGQARNSSVKNKWNAYTSQLKRGVHPNCHLQNAWDQYGTDAFYFEIIDTAEQVEQLDLLEIMWIAKYDSTSRDKGYNIKAGGNRNKVLPQETKDRISNATRGLKRSDEHRKKMSEVISGERHPMHGKPVPEERKDRIAHSLQEYYRNNEMSEDARKNISKALTGKKRKPFTAEHKQRMAESRRKYWAQKSSLEAI